MENGTDAILCHRHKHTMAYVCLCTIFFLLVKCSANIPNFCFDLLLSLQKGKDIPVQVKKNLKFNWIIDNCKRNVIRVKFSLNTATKGTISFCSLVMLGISNFPSLLPSLSKTRHIVIHIAQHFQSLVMQPVHKMCWQALLITKHSKMRRLILLQIYEVVKEYGMMPW